MKHRLAIIPLVALLLLGAIGAINLISDDRPEVGVSEARPAPQRAFNAITGAVDTLDFSVPPSDETIVVNLFASWCAPCRVEHPLLMDLASTHPDRVYGLLYKDTAENGTGFLAELGDPFTAVGLDEDGQGGLDFGLTGVPETFVINPQGEIILHIRGAITQENLGEIRALF